MATKKEKKAAPVKFRLKDLIHRTRELVLLADVIINDEVVEKYPVGHVKLRGAGDPIYMRRSIELLSDYRNNYTKESTPEELEEASVQLQLDSVIIAIEDWDEDFFGAPFSKEAARDIFSKDENIQFYNQIAHYIQQGEHFLPIASQ